MNQTPTDTPVKGILRKPEGDEERVRDESRRLHLKRRETGYFPRQPEDTEDNMVPAEPEPEPQPEVRGILRKPGEKREPKGVMTVAEVEGDDNRIRTAGRKDRLARRDTAYFPPMDVPDEEEPASPVSSIRDSSNVKASPATTSSPTSPRERDPNKPRRVIEKNPYNKGSIVSPAARQQGAIQRAVSERAPPPKPTSPCPTGPPPKRGEQRKSDPADRKAISPKRPEADPQGVQFQQSQPVQSELGHSQPLQRLRGATDGRLAEPRIITRPAGNASPSPGYADRGQPILHFPIPFKPSNLDKNSLECWYVSRYGAFKKISLASEYRTITQIINYEMDWDAAEVQVQDLTDKIIPPSTLVADLTTNILIIYDTNSPPTETVFCTVGRNCRGSKIVLVTEQEKASPGFQKVPRNGNQSDNVYLCELHHQIMKNKGCCVNNESCTVGGIKKQPKNRSFTTTLFGLNSSDFENVQLFLCEYHHNQWSDATTFPNFGSAFNSQSAAQTGATPPRSPAPTTWNTQAPSGQNMATSPRSPTNSGWTNTQPVSPTPPPLINPTERAETLVRKMSAGSAVQPPARRFTVSENRRPASASPSSPRIVNKPTPPNSPGATPGNAPFLSAFPTLPTPPSGQATPPQNLPPQTQTPNQTQTQAPQLSNPTTPPRPSPNWFHPQNRPSGT